MLQNKAKLSDTAKQSKAELSCWQRRPHLHEKTRTTRDEAREAETRQTGRKTRDARHMGRRTSRRKHAPILPNGLLILQGTINHRTSALRIRPGQSKRAPNASSAATHPSRSAMSTGCPERGRNGAGTPAGTARRSCGVPAGSAGTVPATPERRWNAAGTPYGTAGCSSRGFHRPHGTLWNPMEPYGALWGPMEP